MNASNFRGVMKSIVLSVAVAMATMPTVTFSQTPIKLHSNKFPPQDDVKLGQQAAAEAEQKMQLIRDPDLGMYVARVGERLAAAIPPEFQHPEFQYTFKVVNAKDINAFALPGGPMYVNSGMITAARSEDEMAGVMAHEISHVALRHGTAQVTKAQKYQMLSGIMGIGGQVLGGPIGSIAQMGSQGVGVYLLKFSREYETEADLLGARIMANAGYDPRALANMFQTIESQGGGGGPSFLSDHPSPKDRYARINQEAQSLQINTAATPDKQDFMIAQQRLSGRSNGRFANNQGYSNQGYSNQNHPNQRSANQGYPNQSGSNRGYPNQGSVNQGYPNQTSGNQGYPNQTSQPANMDNAGNYPSMPTGRAESPSANYQTINTGLYSVGIPDNWQELEQENGVWFAPKGGYGSANGQTVFTHAVNLGVVETQAKTAQQATDEFINSLKQGANMKLRGTPVSMPVDGRTGQLNTFDNVNEATRRPELVNILTAQLKNGQMFYMIAVCPTDEYKNYQTVFLTILKSVRINDK